MKLIASNQLTVTNLLERAETRRETFYKLTNNSGIPERPEGHRNYITNHTPSNIYWYSNISKWKFETVEDSTARFGRYIKATCTKAGDSVYGASGFYTYFVDIGSHSEFFNKTMTWSMDIKTSKNTKLNIGCEWGHAVSNVNATENWQRFSKTFEVASSSGGKAWIFYGSNWEVGDVIYIRDVQFEYGANATTPSQAPEDLGWSTDTLVPTQSQRYLWKFEYVYYSDGSVEVTNPVNLSIAGADADTTGITETLDKTKQELTAKIEKVQDDSLAAAEEAKQQLTTVANDLSKAKTELQSAVGAVDTKAANLQNDLTKVKTDLQAQASQLTEQASAQSELTKRVSSVEETANGTKTTVSELSKTVDQNGKGITSVTARTKTVEDDLTSTKTTLSQVQSTADSASQKTATLETGLNGLTAKFETLKIGSRNYFKDSKSRKYYIDSRGTQDVRTFINDEFWQNDTRFTKNYVRMSFDIAFNPALPSNFTTNVHFGASPWYNCGGITFKGGTTALQHFDLKFDLSGAGNSYKTDNVFIRLNNTLPLNTAVSLENFNLYLSAVVEDYSQNEADLEQKVAEYKQNADQNYASLQTTVQNLDGTVQQNKTTAEQTAAGFKTRIESLETYKNGEATRANQYFESAKTETARQLTAERTAIAKDYVAKSTYTSDVTGIRNDLTATTTTANTTKTNLANYQASNDRAVANLQSNLQTANGNISSLQTKVEAVPGQITSAVSAVEGKIPANVSTRNLILKSNDFANPHKQEGANTTVTSTNDYFVIKSAGYTTNAWGGMSWNMSISEVKAGEEFSILMPVYIDSSVPLDNGWAFILKNHPSNSAAYNYNIPTNKKDQWFNVAITFKAYKDVVFDTYPFFVCLVKNGLVRIKPPMLVRGNLIPSDYQPAFEDTASQISSLSSQIKQTADGMTLLATKTELNSAKSELQSGISTATSKADNAQATANSNAQTISTHTTQISALNTGLSAKVSQSDFNTLSGRVTTAENNITAKANELSSKITSVEGKIPTETGLRNYVLGTGTAKSMTANGKLYDLSSAFDDIADNATLIIEFDWSVTAPTSTSKFRINRVITYSDGTANQWNDTIVADGVATDISSSSGSGHYSGTFTKVPYNGKAVSSRYLNLNQTTDSGTVTISNLSIRVGSLKSDWQPAPEDYDSALATAQSEIKQTTDSIKASVSALDSSTVKTASLNLDNNGFVTKVGKTVDGNKFATMIAQDANNVKIIADEMQVTADMIVDGAITGDKIKANSVDVTKIVGIDADFIKSKIEYAMIDWLKGKSITAYNDNMTIDLQNGRISFKDGSNAVYRQTPDGIHTGFLHFEAGSQGGIYAAFGATSTRQGVNSKSSEFAGIRCYRVSATGDSHEAKVDKIEVIGDTVQFGHGYRPDGSIGGGFIMDNAAFENETPYSLNRVIKSINALWRVLNGHARNVNFKLNDTNFINALTKEYNDWHDMHNQ